MKLIRPTSLAMTLDGIADAFFMEQSLTKSQRNEVAQWIAHRQGQPGSYAGMFAPTKKDFQQGCTVFTGERVRSGAATSHILGEEACRTLLLLNVKQTSVRKALAQATAGIQQRLDDSSAAGFYCCGICSVSLWRHLMAGGLNRQRQHLRAGLKALKSHRIGNGEWRRFPFWYTLLALSEMNMTEAREEMQYAAPVCQRYLRRQTLTGKFMIRRRLLAEEALA